MTPRFRAGATGRVEVLLTELRENTMGACLGRGRDQQPCFGCIAREMHGGCSKQRCQVGIKLFFWPRE